METKKWLTVLQSPEFVSGVVASVLAAAIVGIAVLIFRNSFSTIKRQRDRGRKESEILDSALNATSPYAPFAFGVAQGRALRYFLMAVFSAYVGDIIAILYPLNDAFYAISLFYIYLGLKWFFKLEKRALEIMASSDGKVSELTRR